MTSWMTFYNNIAGRPNHIENGWARPFGKTLEYLLQARLISNGCSMYVRSCVPLFFEAPWWLFWRTAGHDTLGGRSHTSLERREGSEQRINRIPDLSAFFFVVLNLEYASLYLSRTRHARTARQRSQSSRSLDASKTVIVDAPL